MRYILFILLLIIASCSPAQRATNKVYKGHKIDRIAAGKACYDLYPTHDSVVTNTEYIQGETNVITDTITHFDSITKVVYKTLYKERLRVDTFVRTVDKKIEDTRKADYLNNELGKCTTELTETKSGRNNWRLMAIILASYTGARWVIRYVSKGRIKLP